MDILKEMCAQSLKFGWLMLATKISVIYGGFMNQ